MQNRTALRSSPERRWSARAIVVLAVLAGMALAPSASAAPSGLSAGPLVSPLGSHPPEVTNVAPATGPVSGGTEVAIGGDNFTGATAVDFGGTPATIRSITAGRIEATAPPGSQGTVDVTVTTPEGTSATSPSDHFSYVPPGPYIVELRPDESGEVGGKPVKILGAHFEDVTEVSFGGESAPFEVITPEGIDTVAPPGDAPTVDVRVTTAEGISPITPADHYHYTSQPPEISEVRPADGPATGHTTVHIGGEEFYGVTGVYFGSASALGFTVNSPTSITAESPPQSAERVEITVETTFGPSLGNFCRKNKGTRKKCVVRDLYEYKEPTVESLSPSSGPTAGGTSVTITGTGFGLGENETEFTFNKGVATSVVCSSITSCTAVTPPGTAGTAFVKVLVHGNKVEHSKKNPAAAFHYE
jgi:hypothetical protein